MLTHLTIDYKKSLDKLCISDILSIYIVPSACLDSSEIVLSNQTQIPNFAAIIYYFCTSVDFKKAAVLAIIFPWVSIAPFGFPERKK